MTCANRGLLVAMFALAAAALPQNVPVTSLTKPDVEFPEGFTNIGQIRELRDGRLIFLERCERMVKLIGFASGDATQVGRTGSGPGEYRLPSGLFALPGDSSAVLDLSARRFLVILPDAKPGGFFPAVPPQTDSAPGMVVSRTFSPSITDECGRFYASESGMRIVENQMVIQDSVALERWDRVSGKRDTVAFYRVLNPGPVTHDAPSVPFRTRVQWAIAGDGRVALVHPDDYHVEFISASGVRSVGRPIPFTRVRVSEAHKKQYREQQGPMCARGSRTMTFTGPDGKTATATMMPPREPKEWPAVLPPFLSGAAVFAPDGMLWVQRTGAAEDPPAFDLIAGNGAVSRRVLLAKRSKLLGFGKGVVYVARIDEDDLQYVQRYRLPSVTR
jgi:hypothetical protein